MNVLAIQLKRIGDLILTTPALRALKEATGGARVTLALADNTAPLLPAMREFVDDALVFERGKLNAARWWQLTRERGRFDLAVDFTGNDRSALLTLLSGSKRRLVARDALKNAPRWRTRVYTDFAETNVRTRHTADRYLDYIRALGWPVAVADDATPTLALPAEARAAARLPFARYAVVHPGSARAEKYWPPERWAAVIDHCQRTLDMPVALTGGRGDPFEDQHLASIRAALPAPVAADLAGRLDLLALAALIDRATFFLGVDSGPMHLVAAARRPALVLFGPTNPFHWRPRHAGCLVWRAPDDTPRRGERDADFSPSEAGAPMDQISVAAVLSALNLLPP